MVSFRQLMSAEMLDELKAEIMKVVEDKRAGIEPEEHQNPNAYKPTLTLTAV